MWILIIVLISPIGKTERIEYPPVALSECVEALRADVAADPKGWKIVSASCEVAK